MYIADLQEMVKWMMPVGILVYVTMGWGLDKARDENKAKNRLHYTKRRVSLFTLSIWGILAYLMFFGLVLWKGMHLLD